MEEQNNNGQLQIELEDNIAKYERVFGPIRTSDEPSLPPLAGVKGEA